jgi:hypothetical protein
MRRKLPVVECDLCSDQQVDNGDPTEILGITIHAAFFAGPGGGGGVPKNTFICCDCIYGNAHHGPALLSVLVSLIFHEPQYSPPITEDAYAPKAKRS